MPKLLVRHPDEGDLTFTLTGERITIGRRAENKIQINHTTVSGYHAELTSYNGGYIIRDLDSTNHSCNAPQVRLRVVPFRTSGLITPSSDTSR